MTTRIRLTTIASALAFAALGCATVAPKELVDARSAYTLAAEGPAAQAAPVEVREARKALDAAERAFARDADSKYTPDYAYIAQRKAELAQVVATNNIEANVRAQAEREMQTRAAEWQQRTKEELQSTRGALKSTKGQLDQTRSQLVKAEERALAAEQDAAAAERRLMKLSAVKEVKEDPRGLVVTLSGSVLFASGQATLLPEAQTRLNDVADALLATKERPIVIEGHTDSRGSDSLNFALSQGRAEAVRTFLISRGYDADLISARGVGEERPVATNTSAEGRANNRRVEIVIQPKKEEK